MRILTLFLFITLNLFAQIKIDCLGTSLTAACDYPEELKHELDSLYPHEYKIINMGMGGKNSGTLKTRINEIINDKPDFVLYESAINDAEDWTYDKPLTLDEAKNNLQLICDSLKKFGLVFITMNYPYDSLIKERNPALRRLYFDTYNALFKNVAKINNIPLIDILNVWKRLSKSEYLKLVPDGLHPSKEGSKKITVPVILEYLKYKRQI